MINLIIDYGIKKLHISNCYLNKSYVKLCTDSVSVCRTSPPQAPALMMQKK